MMLAHLDHIEPPAFSQQIAAATRSATQAPFSAKPPYASPAETMKREREQRMATFFAEALNEALEEGNAPAASALENFPRLLQLLPGNLPVTDPYVTESGSICFDWDEDPSCQLSVLLKDRGQIAFAAYFAGEKVNGSTLFSRGRLPESLLAAAKRWSREAVVRPQI